MVKIVISLPRNELFEGKKKINFEAEIGKTRTLDIKNYINDLFKCSTSLQKIIHRGRVLADEDILLQVYSDSEKTSEKFMLILSKNEEEKSNDENRLKQAKEESRI